ncbi:MAG: PrsW family intramembrane metalloprotease [Butyrivibrio sp.]|nr:PrsW family intramembrane metalloprotease [Butyrivibrio sp.]
MLILLAVLPALVLLVAIFKADKREKEPVGLLVKLFIFGVLSTLVAGCIEAAASTALGIIIDPGSVAFIAIDNFLIVALAEEFGKYFVVKRVTWKHPAFNYTFDAVVYAVFASVGFAAFENIFYVLEGGVSTAIMRAILSVPGHAIDAVFMGYYFGLAKRHEVVGNYKGRRKYLRLALLVPVLMHGFYDFCLSVEDPVMIIVFFIYEFSISIIAIARVAKLSAQDTALFPDGYPGANYVWNMYSNGIIRYDPMTGRPYYVDPTRMNFDPVTGQRLR